MNEAELVLTHLLGCERLSLYLRKEEPLSRRQSFALADIFRRRLCGEPVQYILGQQEFMGLVFKVNREVLIPRPETEILVEAAIAQAQRLNYSGRRLEILDIGTGSGCIGICLAKFISACRVCACDISPRALKVAAQNARLNGVDVEFLQGDLFAGIADKTKKFDIIVSNPPYIPDGQICGLARELSYEPALALKGGSDGLKLHRRLVEGCACHLIDGGSLILESGYDQMRKICRIIEKNPQLKVDKVIKDYSGIDRVLVARKEG